jgi:hypothetical protein
VAVAIDEHWPRHRRGGPRKKAPVALEDSRGNAADRTKAT